MAYVYDIVNPTELTAFVRGIDPRTLDYTLGTILPDAMRQTTTYEFRSVTEVRPEIAQYRNWDTPPPNIGRPGVAKQTGAIPPGSVQRPLTEQNRVELEVLRGFSQELENMIFNDADAVTRSVLGRLELAKGEALTRGQVSFTNDRGFTAGVVISYGTPTTITAPAVKFDQLATAIPIPEMQAQVLQWANANNGSRPAFGLTSQSVIDNIMACASVKALFAANGVTPALINQSQLTQLLSNYGLPPLVPYDVSVNIAGTTTRVTGIKEITWLPSPGPAFGETTHGVTVESLELVSAGYLTSETAPGVTVLIDKTTRPTQMFTVATFVSVPVIKDVTKIGNVTVLT